MSHQSHNNEHKDSRTVVPDVPVMRSMMVAPAAAPSLSLVRPEPLAKTSPALQQRPTTKYAPPPPATKWDVRATILPLPSIYMLERTHVTVEAAPEVVADRISDCLRRESIGATFHSREALVEAETNENIRFTVRLWKKDAEQVIVETQKIDGCCFLYCQAAKAVLRSAKGQVGPKKNKSSSCFPVPPCVPRTSEQDQKEQVKAELAHATAMLQSQRLDQQVMALETLVHLSKTSTAEQPQQAAWVARTMLDGNEAATIRSTLLALVESHRLDRAHAESPLTGEVEAHYMAMLRRHALHILANCWQTLHAEGQLKSLLTMTTTQTGNTGWCDPSVVAALVQDVSRSREQPHESCQAVRCLQSLLAAAPTDAVRQRMAQQLPAVLLDRAAHEGACRHALLETACAKLRVEL